MNLFCFDFPILQSLDFNQRWDLISVCGVKLIREFLKNLKTMLGYAF